MSLESDILAVNRAQGRTGPDYAMYTETGNAAVHGLVVAAQSSDANWNTVYHWLHQLSKTKGFEEATDTAVREVVYDKLGFGKKGQNFYI